MKYEMSVRGKESPQDQLASLIRVGRPPLTDQSAAGLTTYMGPRLRWISTRKR